MHHQIGWILYDDPDFSLNRDFASMLTDEGKKRGFSMVTVRLSELSLGMDDQGQAFCLYNGQNTKPAFVLSRQRNALISRHFESMGIPVYNNARVCELCNDKRKTQQFLQGFPMLRTVFPLSAASKPMGTRFPLILKPACNHGGDRILWVENETEWHHAAAQIAPEPMLQQEIASDYGRDLRVYVVFGQIVAAVMRTAKDGYLSNFKQGGQVALHPLTTQERTLAEQIIGRFQEAGAPLCLAGIDFLYHQGNPVVSEIEDVVGSRMLYQVSDLSIAALFWDALAKDLPSVP